MKDELGNLMAEIPDWEGIHSCNLDCQRPVCKLRHDRDAAIEALKDIEAIYLDGNDDSEDKNAMGTIAKNFLFYRNS